MTLQDIFDQLTFGELSQLSIGGNAAGEIDSNNFKAMLAHVNLGLSALYKRFPLKEDRLVVPFVADTVLYNVAADAPNLLKIEKILTSGDVEYPLNDGASIYSLTTPTHMSIRVPLIIVNQGVDLPEDLKSDTMEVVYRANHPKLTEQGGLLNAEDVEIELPEALLNCLCLFVASRVTTPGGMTGEFNPGNNYYAKYEGACADIVTANLLIDQGSQNTRLERGGWA